MVATGGATAAVAAAAAGGTLGVVDDAGEATFELPLSCVGGRGRAFVVACVAVTCLCACVAVGVEAAAVGVAAAEEVTDAGEAGVMALAVAGLAGTSSM